MKFFCLGCLWFGIGVMVVAQEKGAKEPSGSSSASPFDPSAKVEKLADGFTFTEGPASDSQGNVYFTDQPSNRILKWSIEGKLSTFLEKSGRANGMYIDKNDVLWSCSDEKNELWKIDLKTKEHTVVVKGYNGKLLNGPNDVWVSPAGGVYFTDPFYRRAWWPPTRTEEQDKRGVYYLSPKGELTRVDGDFKQPNGIRGTADGKTLYVADINDRKTYTYEIKADGTLGNRKLFCNSGSDGLTIDSEGNVYLTSGAVLVFDKTGKEIAKLPVPESPANVCFGGKDHSTLFITARKGLYAIPTKVKGAGR
ncbi:MAG: SMP-30/gluconolactonase/LRE family protein [Gemmataceae bacterium]|nr:SMP-30/gluconolactonase/LRE family protein [Gemmataceae bacterium]